MVKQRLILSWLACCAVLGATPSLAEEGGGAGDAGPAGFFERDSLTDGWFGTAPALKERGIQFGATEIGEAFAVASGGTGRGAIFEGRLELDLDLDLNKIAGLENTVLHASAYQIHGRGASGNYIGGNLLTVSNIEANRALRLFDLWIERGFFDSAISVRLGQIAADDEFITSQYAGGLILATFGWPVITAAALPGGGPVYPVATPGIRVRGAMGAALVLQAGLFNGDPTGLANDTGNPQDEDPSGTTFATNISPLMIAELAYTPHAGAEGATAGTVYKFGVFYQGTGFDDVARDRTGRSLADPASTGVARRHQGDFGLYGIADLLLYRVEGSETRSLGAFARAGWTPDDRNFVTAYGDAGLAFKGPFEGRDDDVASLGVSFARISGPAGRLVTDLQRFAGSNAHAPDFEAAIEVSYQLALAPWWTVQPDLQMIFHPTAPILRPDVSTSLPRIGNAFVAGMRTSIRF